MNQHICKALVTQNDCVISTQDTLKLIHQRFGHISIPSIWRMKNNILVEVLNTKLSQLEEPCAIFLMTKANIIPRGTAVDVSKCFPYFMNQMDFSFFNVEIINLFTSTFVEMCLSTSQPFEFPSIGKNPTLETMEFIVTKLINNDKKVLLITVYDYFSLDIYS